MNMAASHSTLNKRARKVPTRYERDYYLSGMIESDNDEHHEVYSYY